MTGTPRPLYTAVKSIFMLFFLFMAIGLAEPAGAGSGNLVGATYFGSSEIDSGRFIAVDPSGDVFIAGSAKEQISLGSGAVTGMDQVYSGGSTGAAAIFIARFDAGLATLKAFTYFSGDGTDTPVGLVIDPDGNPVLAGTTSSSDLPASQAGYDTDMTNAYASFLVKLDPELDTVLGFTYVEGGTTGGTTAACLAVDTGGNLFVAGSTTDSDFPVTPGAADTSLSNPDDWQGDGFVARFSNDLKTLSAATFLGGSAWESIGHVMVSADGSVYVSGSTLSSDFPTTQGAYNPSVGDAGSSLFIARLTNDLAGISAATAAGQSGASQTGAMAADSQGNIFITGSSKLVPYPGGTDTGNDHGFILRFNKDLSALTAACSLDYSAGDYGYQIAVDAQDRVVFGGATYATGASTYPITDGTWRPAFYSHTVGMVMRWDNGLTAPDFATVVGGTWGADTVWGLALDTGGNIYVTGFTQTQNFSVDPGGFMTACAGGGSSNACYDAFVAGLDPDASLTGADCLMDWAQTDYPSLFSPSASSTTAGDFLYRYYSGTQDYLGVSFDTGHLYFLDAAGQLTDLGALPAWLSVSGCP